MIIPLRSVANPENLTSITDSIVAGTVDRTSTCVRDGRQIPRQAAPPPATLAARPNTTNFQMGNAPCSLRDASTAQVAAQMAKVSTPADTAQFAASGLAGQDLAGSIDEGVSDSDWGE